ncbi:unnamed protein product [Urochloa humidicola]
MCQPVPSRAVNPRDRWLAQVAAELAAPTPWVTAVPLLVIATSRPQPAWRRWSSSLHTLHIAASVGLSLPEHGLPAFLFQG